MKALLLRIIEQLEAGNRAVLCSILESDGSTPREAGAKMAVFADGTTLGTVGGGTLERLAGEQAGSLLAQGRSMTKRYVLRPNREEDIGMVCGGDVLLGFVCFDPAQAAAKETLRTIAAALDSPCNAWLKTTYNTDGTAETELILKEDIHSEDARLPVQPSLRQTAEQTVLIEPICRSYMVYLFGGGHVGAALVPALAAVGFPVTVFDERADYATSARFPQARRVVCGDYKDIARSVQVRPEDYIVIMTPGHLADYEVLAQALRTQACYIGCIGSKKKVAFVNRKLLEAGFTDDDLARVHSPIGLPILAQTPEEIAVSITAELIYHRRGGR